MRKFSVFALLLVFVLAFSVFPTSVFAEIESLMLPAKSAGWRGFVVECNMETLPSLH